MAIPPNSAVGFLCHLSSLGWAIQPLFNARKRTAGVAAKHNRNDSEGIRNGINRVLSCTVFGDQESFVEFDF